MVQLAFVMSILAVLRKCVRANSTSGEGDEKNDSVDGTEVVVTNTTVSNVTCCGARAANQNQGEVYSKTPVTASTLIMHEERACSEDDQSSNETTPCLHKRGSRIILEINSFECSE